MEKIRKKKKSKINVPTGPLKGHPAGGQETKLFLRVAREVRPQSTQIARPPPPHTHTHQVTPPPPSPHPPPFRWPWGVDLWCAM